MKKLSVILRPALVCFVALSLLCGAAYPAAVTGIAQLIFPAEANGSIIKVVHADGTVREYGSELIAQAFTDPGYLIGRPEGISNLSPTSQEQEARIQERIDWWHSFDPENKAEIPADLVSASGSGADPHISPEAAEYQVSRIAAARGISPNQVRLIIKDHTSGRLLGFLGEPAVNVLKVNLALDGLID